jgi:uncharacterized membrane protein YkvA (DUF1232 family)
MLNRVRWLKRLVRDLPQQMRLAYCLFRDPRVPFAAKAGAATALGIILTPIIDVPKAVPLIRELDVVALTLLTLKLFITLSPPEVVAEQEQLIIEQRSRFDEDVQAGARLATAIWRRLRPRTVDEPGDAWRVDPSGDGVGSGAERAPERSGGVA